MTTRKRLTIITVALNAGDDIQKTCNSIAALKNSLKKPYGLDIVSILVDGGSSDKTLEIASLSEAYDAILALPGSTIYEAMNHGFRQSTADLVAYLNAGDYYLPFALERLLEASRATWQSSAFQARGAPITECLACGRIVLSTPDQLVTVGQPKARSPLSFPAYQPSLIYSRQALEAHPFDTRYQIVADYIQMRLLMRDGFRFCHYPIAVTCFAAGGKSSNSRVRLLEAYKAAREYGFGTPLTRWLSLTYLSGGKSLNWLTS